jgi:hypothetical protein
MTKPKDPTVEAANKETAARLFTEEQLSIAAVGRRLGISDYKAKKLKPVDGEADPEEAAPGEKELMVWPIALEVPCEDLDKMIGTVLPEEILEAVMELEPEDKAQIFTIVLQKRLEKLISEPSEATPKGQS